MNRLSKPTNRDFCRAGGRARSPRTAFTLLELLVVISIIVLLTTITVPVVGSVMNGRSASIAVDRAWGAFSAARQEAVSRQTPIAVVFTTNRQNGGLEKSDAFMLLAAEAFTPALTSTVAWRWLPTGTWRKLPHGIQVTPGVDATGTSTTGFYSPASLGSSDSSYAQIGAALPRLEDDVISDFYFVVFRPDGSVDTASSHPFLEFRRLNVSVKTSDSALVISPDSGRLRMVDYTSVP